MPKFFLKNIFILLLILLYSVGFSQSNNENFMRIVTEQGLPPGNVNDIVQDSLGFLWFGTEGGLCRYDGYSFKIFQNQLNDTTTLSYNNVFSLQLDKNGIIWVGTLGGGLNKFDSQTEKFYRITKEKGGQFSLSYNTIFKVFKDSKENIWISTLGGGLNKLDKVTNVISKYEHNYLEPSSISSNMVSAIYEDSKNRLWLGTFDAGLNQLNINDKFFTHFKKNVNKKYSLNHNQIMDIIEIGNDSLLIATFGGGINIFDIKQNRFFNYDNQKDFFYSTEHKNVRKIYKRDDNIWVGTYNGLYKFNLKAKIKEKYNYNQNNFGSLNNNKIREIFKDRSNNLWIGTINGVNKLYLKSKKFHFLSYNNAQLSKEIKLNKLPYKFLQLNQKDNSFNFSKIKYFENYLLKGNTYSNSYFDEKQSMWMGNYNGLKYLDNNSNEFNYVDYVSNNNMDELNNLVKSFFLDKSNNLWIATLGGGLTYINTANQTKKIYIHSDEDPGSISDSRVIPIYEDSYGKFWVGTYGGLNRFNREKEEFIRYIHSPLDTSSLSNDRIYTIFESKDSTLWIGTYQGLNKYLRKHDNFERITTKEGLADNTIYGIMEDDENNLWLRTNGGISKYNPYNKKIRNYSLKDGLDYTEANGGICFKNKDGKMFFGGLNGFNSFYPKEIKDNNIKPQIVFTDLKIFDKLIIVGEKNDYLTKTLNETKELNLSYKDKIFTIEFSALDFAIPSKNKYAYKLEGFRENWKYVTAKERYATFTNLNSGKYIFHVKASNNDGVWNDKGRKLSIIISPPYWETWWFRLLIIGFILGIIFIFYEIRLSRLIEIEKTRAKIARNLHDDVGGTLASIQYFVNAIKQSKDKNSTDKFLDLIVESSNDVQEKVRDIIWTVNPREDGLSKFMVKFNRYASDIFDSNGINYKINFPKIESEKKINMEKRQHLWFICKETVINTVKHSQCKNVEVNFILINNKLKYIIKDDGIGFGENKHSDGYGLKNIKFRAKKIDAQYTFEPNSPSGTKSTVTFEIN